MMQEIFRCVVCNKDFGTREELAKHKCGQEKRYRKLTDRILAMLRDEGVLG